MAAAARPGTGRFRAAVVEPGAWSLAALRRVDGLAQVQQDASLLPWRWRPAAAGWLVDPPELWALGNTPFEREGAYATLLAQPLLAAMEAAIDRALRSGRVIGGEGFLRRLSMDTDRALVARPRGRPRRD